MTRHHQVHVWFNDELYAGIMRLARQNDEPVSVTLRRIVQEYFRHRGIEIPVRQKVPLAPDAKR
jgi:hypothetical protein